MERPFHSGPIFVAVVREDGTEPVDIRDMQWAGGESDYRVHGIFVQWHGHVVTVSAGAASTTVDAYGTWATLTVGGATYLVVCAGTRAEAERLVRIGVPPAPTPFMNIIYVVVEGLDAPGRTIKTEQMFWSGDVSDFDDRGLAFRWRGKTLRVFCAETGDVLASLTQHDVPIEVTTKHYGRFRVIAKATRLEAANYVVALGSPSS